MRAIRKSTFGEIGDGESVGAAVSSRPLTPRLSRARGEGELVARGRAVQARVATFAADAAQLSSSPGTGEGWGEGGGPSSSASTSFGSMRVMRCA